MSASIVETWVRASSDAKQTDIDNKTRHPTMNSFTFDTVIFLTLCSRCQQHLVAEFFFELGGKPVGLSLGFKFNHQFP